MALKDRCEIGSLETLLCRTIRHFICCISRLFLLKLQFNSHFLISFFIAAVQVSQGVKPPKEKTSFFPTVIRRWRTAPSLSSRRFCLLNLPTGSCDGTAATLQLWSLALIPTSRSFSGKAPEKKYPSCRPEQQQIRKPNSHFASPHLNLGALNLDGIMSSVSLWHW